MRPRLPLVALLTALAACGSGGGDASPPQPPEILLVTPQSGSSVPTGSLTFEVSWIGLDVDDQTLVVELDGQPIAFSVQFVAGGAIGIVDVATAGDHELCISIDAKFPSETTYTLAEASATFSAVASGPVFPGFQLLHEHLGSIDNGSYGQSTAGIADVNGDGVDDYLVGASGDNSGGDKSGVVELRSGATGDLLRSWPGTEGAVLGTAVAALPDLNGDGLEEVLAGAPGGSVLFEGGGGVYVFSPTSDVPLFVYHGEGELERMGQSVAALGDVNGDGTPDYAAGGPKASTNGFNIGTVRIFSGLDGSVLLRRDGPAEAVQFGVSVAALDDIDADGLADVAVGSWGDFDAGPSAGAVYALSGADASTLWKALGKQEDDHFGVSMVTVHDVDGDGLRDLIAGAPESTPGATTQAGTARVCSGADGSEITTLEGLSPSERLGQSCGLAADLNDDGVREWLLGAPFYLNSRGRFHVFDGATFARLDTVEGPPTVGFFGFAIDGAGDFDADGIGEILVGAPSEIVQGDLVGSHRVLSKGDGSQLGFGEELLAGDLALGFDTELTGSAWRLVLGSPNAIEVLARGVVPEAGWLGLSPAPFESAAALRSALGDGRWLQVEVESAAGVRRSNALR